MDTGSLGEIVFGVDSKGVFTPQSLQRERGARFAQHDVQGALPRLEFLAPELANYSFDLHLRADFGTNPVKAAGALSRMCKEGRVVKLIIAGWHFGDVVLEKVSQTWRHLAADGSGPYMIDVTVTIKEYV